MTKMALICWLAILFASIGCLFWHNEWKYSLPTPVPSDYKSQDPGTFIKLNLKEEDQKPVFLHFFNPNCPCSRFNIPEFKLLVKEYSEKINFKVVVISNDDSYTEEDIRDKLNLSIPVLFDKEIAARCGVYSTPQAVLIDANNKLYYRGNYNKSRYCTDKKTNYAQMAIDSLLLNNENPVFAEAALKSYGCTLPVCKK